MSTTTPIVYDFEIELDREPMRREAELVLVSVMVDNSFNLPDLAVMEFADPGGVLLDGPDFAIGSDLRVSVRPAGEQPLAVFVGEITAVEAHYDHLGARTVVRGHDRSHRMLRGRYTRAFRNAKVSEVVTQVAQISGVEPGRVDETPGVHEQISQGAVQDWVFLRRLADQVGYRLGVIGGKLEFRRPEPPAGAATHGSGSGTGVPTYRMAGDLDGRPLVRVRASMTSAGQVATTEVGGWDPRTKQALKGESAASATEARLEKTPSDLAKLFSAGKAGPAFSAPHPELASQQFTDSRAGAVAGQIGGSHAEVEAEAAGDARLQPGVEVEMEGLSRVLSGPYVLSATRHIWDQALGYRTTFVVSDRQDRSLLGLVGGTTPVGDQRMGTMSGVVPAVVSDINDTATGMCQVKVHFPWLSGGYVSDWCRTVQLGAGATRGFEVLPEVGDEVLVAFQNGDFASPVVIGGLHNGKDLPPLPHQEAVKDGHVVKRLFKSRTGQVLLFDDDEQPSSRGVTIRTGDGVSKVVILGGQSDGITLETGRAVTVKATQDVKVETQGNASVTAEKSVSVKANADVQVEALGNATLKAKVAMVEAQGAATVKAAQVSLVATAALIIDSNGPVSVSSTSDVSVTSAGALSLSATGAVAITGDAVSINGTGLVSIAGGRVQVG